MAELHVCPLSRLAQTIEKSGARHVVSLINQDMTVSYPRSVPPENRLLLGFHDITQTQAGFIAPEKWHAEALLAFLKQWDQSTPLILHCWMGISRSTAAAYIAQCALEPNKEPLQLARILREASPQATPNRRLVQFADELLGRGGQMIKAIKAIGRGADACEGSPFHIIVPSPSAVKTGLKIEQNAGQSDQ